MREFAAPGLGAARNGYQHHFILYRGEWLLERVSLKEPRLRSRQLQPTLRW